jgi:hypothetical protein
MGTSPLPDGLGYARIPGLFNSAQAHGWKAVTPTSWAGAVTFGPRPADLAQALKRWLESPGA